MITIHFKDKKEKIITWYVNELVPSTFHYISDDISSLYLDGHELELVRKHCNNLPFHNGPINVLYGDHAKFVVGNLKFLIMLK